MAKNRILVPLNQSESSHRIIDCITSLMPPGGNELILYFVTRPPSPAGFGEPDLSAGYVPQPGDVPVLPTLHPIYESQQRDSIKAHVKAELMPLTGRLRDAGYEVSVKVGFSRRPDDSIVRYLGECNANLVAMTTRGRVDMTRFFFRNLANSIAEKTGLPILLVHTD